MPISIVQGETAKVLKSGSFDPATSVVELPIQVYDDPSTGSPTTTRTYVGILQTVVNLYGSIGGIKSIVSHKGSHTFYELRAVFQGVNPSIGRNPDAEIKTVWKLQPARLTKSLWLIPKIKERMLSLFPLPGVRNRFRTDFEALIRGEYSVQSFTPLHPTGTTYQLTIDAIFAEYKVTATADLDLFMGLLGSYGLGTESWPVTAMMLSRVDIAPSDASVGAAGVDFANFGGLLTTPALLGIESDMIPLIKSRITSSLRLMKGYWLKELPSFSQEDLVKVRVETNYTFADDYDPWIFGKPVGA